jgi:cytochrome c553
MAPTATVLPLLTHTFAGQVEEYIYKQLKNFKAVDGKPAARSNAIMGGMAAPLSDEDMKNVAAWFASQKLKPATATDESKIALGQKIWRQGDFKKGVPACAGCHGPDRRRFAGTISAPGWPVCRIYRSSAEILPPG